MKRSGGWLRCAAIICFCFAGAHASPARAEVVTFDSVSSFDAAAGSTSTIDFNSIRLSSIGTDSPVSVGGDTFAANQRLYTIPVPGSGYCQGYCYTSFLSAQASLGGNLVLTITTPGVTAFAFDYGSYDAPASAPYPLTISINGGSPINLPIPIVGGGNTWWFIGFVDTAPITSLVLSAPGACGELCGGEDIAILDLLDVQQGAPVPSTPLPAALPLFATGIGGLGLLGWCRKRKA